MDFINRIRELHESQLKDLVLDNMRFWWRDYHDLNGFQIHLRYPCPRIKVSLLVNLIRTEFGVCGAFDAPYIKIGMKFIASERNAAVWECTFSPVMNANCGGWAIQAVVRSRSMRFDPLIRHLHALSCQICLDHNAHCSKPRLWWQVLRTEVVTLLVLLEWLMFSAWGECAFVSAMHCKKQFAVDVRFSSDNHPLRRIAQTYILLAHEGRKNSGNQHYCMSIHYRKKQRSKTPPHWFSWNPCSIVIFNSISPWDMAQYTIFSRLSSFGFEILNEFSPRDFHSA